MSATCYQCDKAVKEPVKARCVSKGHAEFTVALHAACIAGYKRSLAKFGSRLVEP